MPFAEHFMLQGRFTVGDTLPQVVNINCGFLPTKVMITDDTQFGSNTGNLGIQQIWWDYNNPGSSRVYYINAAGTAVLTGQVISNGISQYDGTKSVQLGPLVTAGALSKANPAVLTSTAHGLQTGDRILITGPFTAATAMNQLGGMGFSVTVINANSFSIPVNTNTANFTATTVTSYRKIIIGGLYYPSRTNITAITAANPMVVSTATNHGYTVGQAVRIRVPAVFGMTQANNIQGTISAVTSTTFTLGNVDSSAFTAFAWPAVTSLPFTPATVTPIGSAPTPTTVGLVTYNQDLLDDATTNQQFQGFTIGTGLLQTATNAVIGVAAADIITWTAWRADV